MDMCSVRFYVFITVFSMVVLGMDLRSVISDVFADGVVYGKVVCELTVG